jgi:hypothetical protein
MPAAAVVITKTYIMHAMDLENSSLLVHSVTQNLLSFSLELVIVVPRASQNYIIVFKLSYPKPEASARL